MVCFGNTTAIYVCETLFLECLQNIPTEYKFLLKIIPTLIENVQMLKAIND